MPGYKTFGENKRSVEFTRLVSTTGSVGLEGVRAKGGVVQGRLIMGLVGCHNLIRGRILNQLSDLGWFTLSPNPKLCLQLLLLI